VLEDLIEVTDRVDAGSDDQTLEAVPLWCIHEPFPTAGEPSFAIRWSPIALQDSIGESTTAL
jgi:hypothetical protein